MIDWKKKGLKGHVDVVCGGGVRRNQVLFSELYVRTGGNYRCRSLQINHHSPTWCGWIPYTLFILYFSYPFSP